MTKWTFSIASSSFVLLLFACGVAPTSPPTSWTTEYCDTTQRLETLQAIDLVLPFIQTDTLKDMLVAIPKVFMVVTKNGLIIQSSAVSGVSLKHRPASIDALSVLPKADTLTWLDRAYLWSLADRPDYPYDRYQPLLATERAVFIAKRDSMIRSYLLQAPKYTLKVQSDLRGRGNQQRYLAMGKSVTPLSQHNFGFAADIVISLKGTPLKSIHFYQSFLGDIGSKYGLTWGGTFLGFIDPNHVQYFKNSSVMLQQFPELRFEFEPYTRYFKRRVQRMTNAGKAAKVEDTKALLAILHELHKGKSCSCDTLAERPVPMFLAGLFPLLQPAKYQSSRDILLVGDLDSQTATLVHPSGFQKTLRLGKWTAKVVD